MESPVRKTPRLLRTAILPLLVLLTIPWSSLADESQINEMSDKLMKDPRATLDEKELNELADLLSSNAMSPEIRDQSTLIILLHTVHGIKSGANPWFKSVLRKFAALSARSDDAASAGFAAGYCCSYATRFPKGELTEMEIEKMWSTTTGAKAIHREHFVNALALAKWDRSDTEFFMRLQTLYNSSRDDADVRRTILLCPAAAFSTQLCTFDAVLEACMVFRTSESFVPADNEVLMWNVLECYQIIKSQNATVIQEAVRERNTQGSP